MIALWIAAALFSWFADVVYGFMFVMNHDPQLLKPIILYVPDWVFFSALLWVGPTIVMILAAVLGLRGKLPGTRPTGGTAI